MRALPDGLTLLVSAKESIRNSDVHYLFRQESNFLYASGITEPDHIVLLDGVAKRSYLFIPDINTQHQIWVGHQLTTKQAKHLHGFDAVYTRSQFSPVFAKLFHKRRQVYALASGQQLLHGHKIKVPCDEKNLSLTLNELRVFKSPDEVRLMRQANLISHAGHVAAMRAARPGCFEYELQAALEREFLAGGAQHNAYPSIVAGGSNAAVLHYHTNNTRVPNGALVLIDAGCEIAGYASDITRCFPVNGKFSKTQQSIYEIVLHAQKSCIDMVRPGVSMVDLHLHACHVMAQGLIDLGFYKIKDAQEVVGQQLHRYFFPHGIGHMLGLDVHDVGARAPKAKPECNKPKYLRTTRRLEPGVAITVEPGLYFIAAHFDSPETHAKTKNTINWNTAKKYRPVGGIRIEDDILVTKKGHSNLTTVPKEIPDIEKLMQLRRNPAPHTHGC